MVAGDQRIIAEDALNLVELSLIQYPNSWACSCNIYCTLTDNRTTSTVVDRTGTSIELNQWVRRKILYC